MNIRPNITKAFYLLLFIFSFGNKLEGQVQLDVGSDLDVNGEVYDVIDFPHWGQYYIIVGNFTTVGQVSGLNNIAFIDKNTFVAIDPGFITGMSAGSSINTISLFYENTGFPTYYHLYIGGDFTSVNGSTRNGIAKFKFNASNFPIDYSTFQLQAWNSNLVSYNVPTAIVTDMEIGGDTLFYTGDFNAINNAFSYPNDDRLGVTAVDVLSGSDYGMFNPNSACNSVLQSYIYAEPYGLELTNKRIYVTSYSEQPAPNGWAWQNSIFKFDYSGCFDGTFLPISSNNDFGLGRDICFLNDTVFGIVRDNSGLAYSAFYTDTSYYGAATGMVIDNTIAQGGHSENITKEFYSGGNGGGGYTFSQTSIASYKDVFYMLEEMTYSGGGVALAYLTISGTDSIGKIWSAPITSNFPDFDHEHIFVEENVLFVSKNGPIMSNGTQKGTGLIAYCLEPADAEFFSISDSTVCAGQIITYTIPQADFADGYDWEYTGTGADLSGAGFPTETLIKINGTNTITIEYLNNFTPGQLKVTPFSTCGGLTESNGKVYSNTIITNITGSPLPNAVAGLDSTLNCLRDTIVFTGYSDTLNTTFAWLDGFGDPTVLGTDTTVAFSNFINNSHDFIFQVTDQLGCRNYDTVTVTIDTIKPPVTLPALPWELTCANPSINFTGTSSDPNAILSWSYNNPNFTTTSNPINVSLPGSYMFRATNPINGCADSSAILVSNNVDLPNITIVGYPPLSASSVVDILDCYTPSLSLVCASDTANVNANWVGQDSLNPIGDTKIITQAGTYYIKMENTTNGCIAYKPIAIGAFFDLPIVTVPLSASQTCSRDSVVLDGTTISLDTNLTWNSANIFNGTNPIVSYDLGWHSFTVFRNDNGCSLTDSVEIIFEPTIDVFANDDTLICNNTDVGLNVNYAGTLINVLYNWDNGSSISGSTYNSETDTYASVIVTADNGCIGYDTVRINTPNIPTTTADTFTPCDGGLSGKIIVNVTDGLSPYTYALENGSFQSSSLFENLAIGTYNLTVADSINCEYTLTAEITDNGPLPEPLFIFSTYNVQADTVVLVDVSTPPADFIDWDFPFEVTIFDDNNLSSPVIILPDTGVFQITMNAHYGSCIIPVTKWIYSKDYDSTLATNYNQNGIKSVELYPNPNSGVFTVEIEFYKRQRSVTTVQDMAGYAYYWQENNEDDLIITHQIDLGANIQPGTYVLKVASEFDSYYITFVVN